MCLKIEIDVWHKIQLQYRLSIVEIEKYVANEGEKNAKQWNNMQASVPYLCYNIFQCFDEIYLYKSISFDSVFLFCTLDIYFLNIQ